MTTDGFRFFLGTLGLSDEAARIYFNFTNPTGTTFSTTYNFSGIPYSNSSGGLSGLNTGLFNGNSYLNIIDSSTISSDDWTMFFLFQKNSVQDGVLFSNYQGETVKSGFVIGINSANKLYAESYDEGGPAIYESETNLSSKNGIAVSKNSNFLTFDYFDFNSKNIQSDNFTLSNLSFSPSENWYLGSAINHPSYFSGNNFVGSIDAFIYLTGNYFPYEIDTLFSGFTLAYAPQYYYTVLDESCYYSYLGLTGSVEGITFNPIDTLSYLVQTGYLVNKTGELVANITGNILTGLGTASGFITGYIDSGSGWTMTGVTSYTGVTGQETIANGLRIFQNSVPTGTSGSFFLFPTSFTGNPIVFNQLNYPSGELEYQVSGISSSGFYSVFSDVIRLSGATLNTLAALPQDNPSFKLNRTQISQGVSSQFIQFNSIFQSLSYNTTNVPTIFAKLENNNEQIVLGHEIQNVTPSGFTLLLTNTTTTPNYYVDYIATTTNWGFEINQITGQTGNSFSTNFASGFASNPIVFGETRYPGYPILSFNITGVNTTGFFVDYSNILSGSQYVFNYMAWSGIENFSQQLTQTISGLTYIGQITDEAENIYNLSGYGVSTLITEYDLPLNRNLIFSGTVTGVTSGISIVPTPISLPVNYSISLLTGQTANFIHSVYYNNQGTNFLTANHTLYYNNLSVQPSPFYIYKYCNQYLGLALQAYTYNSGYIYSFGMDGISYTGNINSNDYSELAIFPQSNNKTNINKVGIIDRSQGYYLLDQTYTLSDINLWENGVALMGSGFYYTGSVYNQSVVLEADFALTGSYIIPPDNPTATDMVLYDIITNTNRDYFSLPTSFLTVQENVYLPILNVSNKNVYLNGVKLVSGVDYWEQTVFGSDLVMVNGNYRSIQGEVFTFPNDTDIQINFSGNFNSQLTPKFARGTSILFANGVRQIPNIDYIEIGNISLLTGQRTLTNEFDTIVPDDGLFWE